MRRSNISHHSVALFKNCTRREKDMKSFHIFPLKQFISKKADICEVILPVVLVSGDVIWRENEPTKLLQLGHLLTCSRMPTFGMIA